MEWIYLINQHAENLTKLKKSINLFQKQPSYS